jgi:hypothetical protein
MTVWPHLVRYQICQEPCSVCYFHENFTMHCRSMREAMQGCQTHPQATLERSSAGTATTTKTGPADSAHAIKPLL